MENRIIYEVYDENFGENHWLSSQSINDAVLPSSYVNCADGRKRIVHKLFSNADTRKVELTSTLDINNKKITSNKVEIDELEFAEVLMSIFNSEDELTFMESPKIKELIDTSISQLTDEMIKENIIPQGYPMSCLGFLLLSDDKVCVFDKVTFHQDETVVSHLISSVSFGPDRLFDAVIYVGNQKFTKVHVNAVATTKGDVSSFELNCSDWIAQEINPNEEVTLQYAYTKESDLEVDTNYYKERKALLDTLEVVEDEIDDRFADILF